ncbi:MAG TPA: hypothetical protein VD837_18695 [Terriglobales bacterium]|nr:hypothetical protein [Terriglobales bacterium]
MSVPLFRRTLAVVLILVALALVSGCSKVPGSAEVAQTEKTAVAEASHGDSLPFSSHGAETNNAARSETGSSLVPDKAEEPALVPDQVKVPAGSSISIRLQSSVSSATAQSGDHFDAVLDAPLVVNGRTVAGKGTPVVGRVAQARRSGRLHNSGYLRLTLASIEIKGRQVPVTTSSVSAQGGAHKKRNVALIGGGAGGGALIGALAGGGKGALIGSAVGAAAGTTGAYATGKKDVSFGAERRLTFRLTQSVTLD